VSEKRQSLGLGALALVPIACCIGLPLIAAAGVSIALAVWVGGAVVGAAVLCAAVFVLALRLRRRSGQGGAWLPIGRSRS
jgi:hypothetical protein